MLCMLFIIYIYFRKMFVWYVCICWVTIQIIKYKRNGNYSECGHASGGWCKSGEGGPPSYRWIFDNVEEAIQDSGIRESLLRGRDKAVPYVAVEVSQLFLQLQGELLKTLV